MGPLLDLAEIKAGQRIPDDLAIYTDQGEKRSLAEVVNGKHTVLVSGCLTCPIFHRSYPEVEAVHADYRGHADVQFFYMYKSLAHPELNGYVQPATLDERLAHIVEAKRVLGTRIDWLCDGTDNAVRHALGFGPNTQIVIGPDGKVLHSLGWSDGAALREQLVSFVGESDSRTSVADLELKRESPYRQQRAYGEGVLEKPSFSSELAAVKITPIQSADKPLYVKPRIEVDSGVLEQGEGELYLGFFLDPLHHVHWNNLAAPLKYEFTLPDGTLLSPSQASAPVVEQESDSDPREFKLAVSRIGEHNTAELAIHYFACSKEEGWCIPVTQKYAVTFERDRDGGGTNGRSFRVANAGRQGGPGGRGGPGPRGGQRGGSGDSVEQMRQRISQLDTNGDGALSLEEAPEGMRQRFPDMDSNGDNQLDFDELEAMIQRRAGGAPQGRGAGQGAPGNTQSIKQRILYSDANNDGLISREELPEQMQRRFNQMDADGNGSVDEEEIDAMIRNRPQGGPGQGRNRGNANRQRGSI